MWVRRQTINHKKGERTGVKLPEETKQKIRDTLNRKKMKSDKKPILKETEICASFTGKISTSKFENLSPFFGLKETWENVTDDNFIKNRQETLQKMCYTKFSEIELRCMVEKIKEQRQDLRFYEHNGVQYPSVTSIINWDEDMHVPPQQLAQYAARGICIHKQCEIFLKTGQWIDAKDIAEIYPSYVIVRKGDLGLAIDDVDFQAFYKKHPFESIELEKRLINETYKYAGRTDIVGIFDGKKTIFDIKTGATVNKEKAFKQLSAYAKCLDGIEQMVVIHLNNGTKQGFSQPIVSDEIEKYFEMFKNDRKLFKDRFGI